VYSGAQDCFFKVLCTAALLLATSPLGPFLRLHLLVGTLYLHTFVLPTPYPPSNAAENSISTSLPLPSSHPVPAPQIRFRDFWRYINLYVRMYVYMYASPLRELTCHTGSHSVTFHPAEVTFPPLPQPKLVLEFFKVLFSSVYCLHSLLPPVESNPYMLRSRDHNFQLPVCNNFRRKSFIIYSLFRFKWIFIVFFVCFVDCQLVFFSYACSIVYYIFCTIAIPTAFNSAACTFVTCF